MTQPPAPPPPASQPPPQPHSAGGSSQVCCAGCRMILTVGAGITEFVCPSCKMPQMLPPELMKKALAPPLVNNNIILHKMTSQQQLQTPAHGVDPSKMQLPCANCKAILNVPHGLARFQCPQCLVDLAVDLSKIKQLFPPPATLPLPTPSRSVLPLPRPILPPPPLEEVNEIVRPAVGESVREMPLAELKNKYQKLLSLDKARNGWEDEYEVSSKQCMHGPNCRLGNFCTVGRRRQEVNVLGGLILPVWGTTEKALSKQARQSHKRLRVVRLETTTDNRRIVGLLVPNVAVESVLQDLAWVQDIDD